ncbi:ACP S-malonyltransferase [Streptomyces sp. SID12488]|nr:ACP S-malonyltransferase [Streptomyces sp. SID12488]NEA65566.1 ACP S-malonyltransferase [Streptomyces sp. SID12488]
MLDSGVPEITALYEEAARALGVPGRPERLLPTAENLPGEPIERQGFIGAALLVHSLALDAFLRDRIDENGTPVGLVAYTGESFGILAAAVASGSLSVFDGVKIAQAFTPLMLLAAGTDPADATAPSYDGPFARAIAWYLPESVRRTPLVPEPSHVLAVRARTPDALATVLDEIRGSYPARDVELHKTYSPTQVNLYVRAGVKAGFDRFMAAYPHIATEELKDPTVFLAHSSRMRPARHALERFLDVNRIRFEEPRVPVVSNHDASLLTTAAGVRRGVLAMTDQVMASRDTCEILGGLDTDMVLELGPGAKSVQLLRDNDFAAPVLAYTGGEEDTETFLRAVTVVDSLMASLERLYAADERSREPQEPQHAPYDILRELFRLADRSEFCDDYFSRSLGRVITAEMLSPSREGSAAFYAFLETFQHTRNHREHIAVGRGELVVKARLKKRITGAAHEDPDLLGRATVELKVLDHAGNAVTRTVDTARPEVVVSHFDALAGVDAETMARRTRLLLDTQPTALQTYNRMLEGLHLDRLDRLDSLGDDTIPRIGHRVVYQYLLFDALVQHRPALFAQSDHYLEGGDPLGWLVALAVAGSLSPADAVVLFEQYERDEQDEQHQSHEARARARLEAVERMLERLAEAEIPLVSPEGVPVRSRRDLQDATRAVLLSGALDGGVRRVHLNGNCQVLALGSDLSPTGESLDTGRYDAHLVRITEPAESWKRRLNPDLDAFESACVLALTEENERVLHNARSRRLLSSTVYAYTHIDEAIVNFGKGGSESMTIFVRKAGEERITVRKILSEALTTAHWHPDGDGVMLPPFAKAAKQAEFLQSLPAPVRDYFPEVYDVLEREVPVGGPNHGPAHGSARTVGREVIYEMSYVAGDEVSRFVEKHTPPPAVVARLYEQIIRVLYEDVHSVGRVAAPGETLDISYFRKIEDRLALCRRTAPRTFGSALLDTERIVVNGVSYLNSGALLQRFRAAPEFLEILEPAFHSLVMGDTNTENIKITNSEPLLHAQRLIESGADEGQVRAALDAITADALGIKFLDPRAIGFKGEGRDTRDDAMYDNKPWHNSIGHYDEIHFEQFTMNMEAGGAGAVPRVDISFLDGNPYQRAYRVRDVVATGGSVDPDSPDGMEDWFAPVMTAALGLDDPGSAFLRDDPYWLIRFVFMMGQHFTAMPPFHFQQELDGTLVDTYRTQRRPVAIYCEGVKWLNWALEMLEGTRTEFLGLRVPPLPYRTGH